MGALSFVSDEPFLPVEGLTCLHLFSVRKGSLAGLPLLSSPVISS